MNSLFFKLSNAKKAQVASDRGHFVIAHKKIPYIICKSKRRKRTIALFVEQGENIRVLAPAKATLASIQDLVNRQSRWIARRLRAIQEQQKINHNRAFISGEKLPYQGELLPLCIQ